LIVHKHRPESDGRLRLKWIPVFIQGGVEELGSGSKPSEEVVEFNRIIGNVQLHDGVISHAAARYLDKLGYTFDPKQFAYEQGCLEQPSLKDVQGVNIVSKLEKFCMIGRASLEHHPVQFVTNVELQKWLNLSVVDFAEVFRGFGEATIRVREAGCTASEGFDNSAITYERTWHLDRAEDQQDCAFVLCFVLKPKVIHQGTPCTNMCVLGKRQIDGPTHMQNEFSRKVCLHQQEHGRKASV
jgi:hypothetical protein